MKELHQVDKEGFYGEFGGAFIPEMLVPNIQELADSYREILDSESFRNEFKTLQ
jgi:tryptophan synthase beta chain